MNKLISIVQSDFGNDDVERPVIEAHGFACRWHNAQTPEAIIEAGRGASGVLVEWVRITDDILAAWPECRVVARYGVGYDNVDIEAAARRGIAVMNVPDYCPDEVAEHAIALMFAVSRCVVRNNDEMRRGEWRTNFAGFRTLTGKTFGIIGFGRIGKATAKRAAGLGMRLIAYDINPLPLPGLDVHFTNSLEALLAQADVVSLHVPLTPLTHHMIDAEKLALMKHDAILVNTARGPVVVQQDLADALLRGHLAGAGLDVHETEPLPIDAPIRQCPNVVLTSHMAFYSPESLIRMRSWTAQNAVDFLRGIDNGRIVNGIRPTSKS
ncbi:MAG: C-terminal binding protein [Anaerolineae bacterium]|nr:C-terminal binding protein [Thermoflexales bacterium]MDW8406230.1 C-terminal binding protein [Anaerolineae bacterium]